jgi:aspartate beta-hydroxylase
MSTQQSAPSHSDWINRARSAAQAGRLPEAEQAYMQALRLRPRDVEGLNFVGMCAIGRGEAVSGTLLLKKAVELEPGNAAVLCNLGSAYRGAGEWELARATFEQALAAAPRFADARLYLAEALEQLGRTYEALTNYFGAILQAQGAGQWMSEAGTPPMLRPVLLHAMEFVAQGRRAVLETAYRQQRDQYGSEALRRVDDCVLMYLKDLPTRYTDERQQPGFLFFPDLPTQPWFEPEALDWVAEYEAAWQPIAAELAEVRAEGRALEPVHAQLHAQQLRTLLASDRGTAQWDAFFFFRHGAEYADNLRRCPATAAALQRLPLGRIREHGPEVFFSILKPGTHILPHRGVTNVRSVTHLPLMVPEGCALRVGGETREWREGKVLMFDDTFEHEAWNRGEATRVVLIADVWNPHLSLPEREALAALIPSIGRFNRDCGID